MLTQNEENRVFHAIPSRFAVQDRSGGTVTYDANKWWSDQDHGRDTPYIVLGWDAREVPRREEMSMNQIKEFITDDGEIETGGDVEYRKAIPVYDELVVQCHIENVVNDGIPAADRARDIANSLSDFFNFRFDQNSEGENGERPVLARVVGEPVYAGENRGSTPTVTYQFTVALNYQMGDNTPQDLAQGAEGVSEMTDEGDTDFFMDLSKT